MVDVGRGGAVDVGCGRRVVNVGGREAVVQADTVASATASRCWRTKVRTHDGMELSNARRMKPKDSFSSYMYC